VLGNGTTTVSDTVNMTQSNRVNSETITAGSTTLNSSFTYDAADHLTAASIGTNTYSYGFGAESSSCNTVTGNTNAGKDSNRTTQTINGTTTTFCYNQADQLVSSSSALYNTPVYDTRGNMTQLGTNASPLQLGYDSSNRNANLVQTNAAGTGTGMYYNRDVTDRITYREQDTITTWNWALTNQWFYGFTGGGNSDFVRDANWDIVEKTVALPGGVLLTIKPQATGNAQKQYSLPNALGRTMLTTNAAGTNTSNGNGPASSFAYDPFGNAITGSVLPANTVNGSYGYAGAAEKLTEISLALAPIQMGARVYIAGMARFTSPDPIPGGTPAPYAYTADPINGNDFSGMLSVINSSPYQSCIQSCGSAANYLQPATPSAPLQNARTIDAIQGPSAPHGAPIPIPAASTRVSRVTTSLQRSESTTQTVHMLTDGSLKSQSYQGGESRSFSLYDGASTAITWYSVGGVAGGMAGCIAGALLTAGLAGEACLVYGAAYVGAGSWTGAGIGFFVGGSDSPIAHAFDWWPDDLRNPWEDY
jgi:RHS repeat-associated protein